MMLKILFIVCIILAVIGVIESYIINKLQQVNEQLEKELNCVVDTNHELMRQLKEARNELDVKAKKRKESETKINNLYNGDSVNNAINGLSKPKN